MWPAVARLATLVSTAWMGAWFAKDEEYANNSDGTITGYYKAMPMIMRVSLWGVLIVLSVMLFNYWRTGKFQLKR
jgi:uncharacterized membrane protein